MDATRFDGFTRTISSHLTRRTGLGLLAGASLALLGMATPAAAKKKKVTLCFNGQTIQKPKKKARKLQKQGATKGACVVPSGCPDGQKACGDTCIPNAQCCNCTGDEVCENGNCAPLRCGNGGACKVFVTASEYKGIDLGSLAGADTKCTSLANGSGLSGTFKAWLSDSTANAKDRFDHPNRAGPWVLVSNGDDPPPTVADNLEDLITCPGGACLQHAINRREDGSPAGDNDIVWTGTQENGNVDDYHCDNWSGGAELGRIGTYTSTGPSWTNNGGTQGCDVNVNLFRFYCFQQAT